ncbi:heparinase II/III family protein [Shewanella sp. MSW]|uniref:heparinase II/III family protein n=1 Tax=Shewanella sp. MSW TaxID=2569536 RepID=UPI00118488D1|nr:heparinase II/III family protein [Shewanella sp. MSW]TVP09751.1 heparinase [Shewanella sp. MSW]
MKNIFNFYYTLKHLKPIQLFNRFIRLVFKVKPQKCPKILIASPKAKWVSVELSKSSYVEGDIFSFLNHQGEIGNWNDNQQQKLWLYNLHYFDDLNAENSNSRQYFHSLLIERWIANNPQLVGNGWEPYPLSLRIVNWIKWFLSGNPCKSTWQESLWEQAAVLEQSLEYHLLGNHLLANAKALVFAGIYFDDDAANRWLNKGLRILDRELKEQILDDGGNFELSPMYHNIILTDILDLINLTRTYSHPMLKVRETAWKQTIYRMLTWMQKMTHPNGDLAFFNDSAINIAPSAERIWNYADMLGISYKKKKEENVTYLKNTGYIHLANGKQTSILDVARVGPDYIPGHAHADTLSFEWNYENQRVLVNSGTSVYGVSIERLRQRKTESHNTVVVDEEDSSEVWSGFRVARRAYPSKPIISEGNDSICVECSHDGYMRLRGKVTHSRQWVMNNSGFYVTDKLLGKFNSAQAHYHFHPGMKLEHSNDKSGQVNLYSPDGAQFRIEAIGADIEICDSTWHPEFGVSISNKKIVLNFKQPEIKFGINIVNK